MHRNTWEPAQRVCLSHSLETVLEEMVNLGADERQGRALTAEQTFAR